MKKILLSIMSLLILSNVAFAGNMVSEQKCISAGDTMLNLELGLNFLVGGGLYNNEDQDWGVSTSYSDYTTQNGEIRYGTNLKYGVYGEYMLTNGMGLQLGYYRRGITQALETGDLTHETNTFGEGSFLKYGLPFVGISLYPKITKKYGIYFAGRYGIVTGGEITPFVAGWDTYNKADKTFDITGSEASIGLGVNYVYDSFVIGCSCFYGMAFLKSNDAKDYYASYLSSPDDLTASFVDININLGVRI